MIRISVSGGIRDFINRNREYRSFFEAHDYSFDEIDINVDVDGKLHLILPFDDPDFALLFKLTF